MLITYLFAIVWVICIPLKIYCLIKIAQINNYKAFWKTLLIIFIGLMYLPIIRSPKNRDEAILIRKANYCILLFWIAFFITVFSTYFFI